MFALINGPSTAFVPTMPHDTHSSPISELFMRRTRVTSNSTLVSGSDNR
jgi:hypothetical protein